jgi:hypothetical protein
MTSINETMIYNYLTFPLHDKSNVAIIKNLIKFQYPNVTYIGILVQELVSKIIFQYNNTQFEITFNDKWINTFNSRIDMLSMCIFINIMVIDKLKDDTEATEFINRINKIMKYCNKPVMVKFRETNTKKRGRPILPATINDDEAIMINFVEIMEKIKLQKK